MGVKATSSRPPKDLGGTLRRTSKTTLRSYDSLAKGGLLYPRRQGRVANVSASTLRGYTRDMTNYIIKPLGEMYMEEVTADDIRLALVPLSKKSEGLYNKVNMLLKCIFYTAERSQSLEHNPCEGISGKGGKPAKKRDALTDQQVAVLLDTVKGLPLPICYAWIVFRSAPGRNPRATMGLCISGRAYTLSIGEAGMAYRA